MLLEHQEGEQKFELGFGSFSKTRRHNLPDFSNTTYQACACLAQYNNPFMASVYLQYIFNRTKTLYLQNVGFHR